MPRQVGRPRKSFAPSVEAEVIRRSIELGESDQRIVDWLLKEHAIKVSRGTVQRVTAAVSHWLSVFTDEAVELRPDLDQIPALAAERDQQWARVGAADFLTPAEKRVLLGLPRLSEEE